MSGEQLSREQLEAIKKVQEEWLAEAAALKGTPDPESYMPFGFDGNHGEESPTKLLTKKYMRKILEIKGKPPRGDIAYERKTFKRGTN